MTKTHAVATRFRSSGETFFLRGLTGRRCSGDAVEADEMSRVAERFDGLGIFWHRVVAGGVRRGSAGSTAQLNALDSLRRSQLDALRRTRTRGALGWCRGRWMGLSFSVSVPASGGGNGARSGLWRGD